jgi:hypothetical protein
MTKTEQLDIVTLAMHAQNSVDREAYVQMEKTRMYRIGVGAKANQSDASTFFVEVLINLSAENKEVDLHQMEDIIACLEALKLRGYSLTYEDDNSISCETKTTLEDPSQEYRIVKTLMHKAHL